MYNFIAYRSALTAGDCVHLLLWVYGHVLSVVYGLELMAQGGIKTMYKDALGSIIAAIKVYRNNFCVRVDMY